MYGAIVMLSAALTQFDMLLVDKLLVDEDRNEEYESALSRVGRAVIELNKALNNLRRFY